PGPGVPRWHGRGGRPGGPRRVQALGRPRRRGLRSGTGLPFLVRFRLVRRTRRRRRRVRPGVTRLALVRITVVPTTGPVVPQPPDEPAVRVASPAATRPRCRPVVAIRLLVAAITHHVPLPAARYPVPACAEDTGHVTENDDTLSAVDDTAESGEPTAPVSAGYERVDGEAAAEANARWWTAASESYLAEHGGFLGAADFCWSP